MDTEAVLVDQSGLPVQAGQDADQEAYQQGHYIEVAQGAIFMEQSMRFGLILGRLAILKKKSFGPIMSNFWGGFFMFSLAKQMLKFFEKHCSFHTKMLRNIFFIEIFFLNFFGKNWLNIHNQFCIALLQATDTFMRNFYKMTLLSKTLLK